MPNDNPQTTNEKCECPVCGAFTYPAGTNCNDCRDYERRQIQNERQRKREQTFGGGWNGKY